MAYANKDYTGGQERIGNKGRGYGEMEKGAR